MGRIKHQIEQKIHSSCCLRDSQRRRNSAVVRFEEFLVAKNIYFCPKELFSLSTPAVQNHICSNLSASSVCQSLVSNIQLPFPGTLWQDVLSQIPEIFPGKSITQGADCILECDIREGHLCILIHNICIVLFKHAKHFTHIMLSSKQPER